MEGSYLKVSHLTSVSFRIFRQSVLKIDNSLGQLADDGLSQRTAEAIASLKKVKPSPLNGLPRVGGR